MIKQNKSRYIAAQKRLENLSKLETENAAAKEETYTWKAKIGGRWITGPVTQPK